MKQTTPKERFDIWWEKCHHWFDVSNVKSNEDLKRLMEDAYLEACRDVSLIIRGDHPGAAYNKE